MHPPTYTFESFLVDDTCRSALHTCENIANQDPLHPQLLWLHGPCGCGKTHLLKATCHRFRTRNPDAVVVELSASELVSLLVAHLSDGDTVFPSLERVDLLALDHLQELAGTPVAQSAIAELLAARHAAGKTTLLASTCPPEEMAPLSAPLMAQPDAKEIHVRRPTVALKQDYIRERLAATAFPITEAAILLLTHQANSLPEMAGALQSARLHSLITRTTADADYVSQHLSNIRRRF